MVVLVVRMGVRAKVGVRVGLFAHTEPVYDCCDSYCREEERNREK